MEMAERMRQHVSEFMMQGQHQRWGREFVFAGTRGRLNNCRGGGEWRVARCEKIIILEVT